MRTTHIGGLYLGLIFPTRISHLAHIGNTYPSSTEFLYGTNFPCLVGIDLSSVVARSCFLQPTYDVCLSQK
jgi:hypothetical protein